MPRGPPLARSSQALEQRSLTTLQPLWRSFRARRGQRGAWPGSRADAGAQDPQQVMLGAQVLLLYNDEANETPCSPADNISGAVCIATQQTVADLSVRNKRPAQAVLTCSAVWAAGEGSQESPGQQRRARWDPMADTEDRLALQRLLQRAAALSGHPSPGKVGCDTPFSGLRCPSVHQTDQMFQTAILECYGKTFGISNLRSGGRRTEVVPALLQLLSTSAGSRLTVQHAAQAQHDGERVRGPCATNPRALPQAQSAPTAAIFDGGYDNAEESSAQAEQARESAQILDEVRYILRILVLCLFCRVQSADFMPQRSTVVLQDKICRCHFTFLPGLFLDIAAHNMMLTLAHENHKINTMMHRSYRSCALQRSGARSSRRRPQCPQAWHRYGSYPDFEGACEVCMSGKNSCPSQCVCYMLHCL